MIVSTILLALALAAAQLPRLAARTRYAIVFAALLKFAVPSSIVPHAVAASVSKPVMIVTALQPLTAAPTTTFSPFPLLVFAWAIVAVALTARVALRWRRSVTAALASSVSADDPALAAAAARIGLRRRVALRRSPSVLAPVTIGVARPAIVIPDDLALTPAQLESILAHECAHVARHDNALTLIEALFGCALWFHPLVWMARRVLARAREQACDERVVASGDRRVYLDALTRVAAHGIAQPAAGVSCASGHPLEERIDIIMKNDSRRPLPHRLVIASAFLLIALVTMGAAPAGNQNHYNMTFAVQRNGAQFTFDIKIIDRETGEVIAHPNITTSVDTAAEASTKQDSEEWRVTAIAHPNGRAEVTLRVLLHDQVIETMQRRMLSTDKSDRISLDLKDADVTDVLGTFGKLANLHVVIDKDVKGTVNADLHDVPWTEALDQILRDAGLRYELRGSNLHVYR